MPEFALPDVGEGLTEAEVVRWLVAEGDDVAVNDPVVEIETAKSIVELPVPFAGKVQALLVAEGETVPVGTALLRVGEAREAVLVGYGPKIGGTPRRRRRAGSAAAEHTTAPVVSAVAAVFDPSTPVSRPSLSRPPTPIGPVLATPPVRALARDLGVDLRSVVPTGADGVVTRDDLRRAASALASDAPAPASAPDADAPVRRAETRTPIRGVRKATAAAVTASAFTAPHVTEWLDVDITRTVKALRRRRKDAMQSVSLLAVTVRALCLAAVRTPEITQRWDEAAQELVTPHYLDVGIAVATPRGLVVPVLRDADRDDAPTLAVRIADLAEAARAGRLAPADLAGGTISITNVGVFGVDGGTPILPPGQSGIVAVGRATLRPWVHRGKVRPRTVVTLALSFDHRVVDGEQGSRVLTDVAAVLERPERALLGVGSARR